MENNTITKKFKFKNNNSFIYINNTPKILRFSRTPVMANYDRKIINLKKNTNNSNNEKMLLKKKPYINFNFNLIQNKNLNGKKIRTITPNLKLREIVNKKFQENNVHNLNNIIKYKTELPEITKISPYKSQSNSYVHTESNYKRKDQSDNFDRQLKLIFVMKNKINELNKVVKEKNKEIIYLKSIFQKNDYERIIQKRPEKENNLLKEKSINKNKKENKTISKDKDKDKDNTMKINNIKKDNYNNSRNNNNNNNSINNNNINNNNTNNNNTNNNNNNNNNTNNTNTHKSYNKNNHRLTLVNTETEKLNKEIQNLNQIINNLDGKYQEEIKKNKEFNQKYNYIKNCTFGINVPTVKFDEKVKNYENKIIDLEEQIYEYKQREIKNNRKKIILSNEEYSNIQMCINALINIQKIKQSNILYNINSITFANAEEITDNICRLLKIKENNLILYYINDFIIKNRKGILYPITLDPLFKYDIVNNNFVNNKLFSFLKERATIYDYKKEGIIPVDYLKHIYKEFCFTNNKEENEKEFFNIVLICKYTDNDNNSDYSNNLYDIYYNNLKIINDDANSEKYYNFDYYANEKMVKSFIDSIMNEELEKFRKRERFNQINKETENDKKNENKDKNDDDILLGDFSDEDSIS